jgi:predicted nucleic acid-binding protein
MTAAVSNSTCLIGLERIQRLEILPQVFDPITVPTAVQPEVGISAPWLAVQAPQNRGMVQSLQTQIDAGEAEAIALAMELGDVFVILDDLSARRIAHQLDLKVVGTVGLFLRAKQQGVISEIKPILDALTTANFRISDALIRKALQLAGE